MLLSAVSVLVVAQSSSEIPEGLMNNPVLQELWQLKEKSVNLLTGYTDADQRARALDTIVEMGRENAFLARRHSAH